MESGQNAGNKRASATFVKNIRSRGGVDRPVLFMNYGNIKNCDIADGVGVRVSLFVSGCNNRCENCFNPETWDFNYGQPFTEQTENQIIEMLKPPFISGLTVLGGEPFEPSNQKALLPFLKKVKQIYPLKTIWMYSGFTFEEMFTDGVRANTEWVREILKTIDVLVDGKFVEAKKDISPKFRGSSNQRILDVKQSLDRGEAVIANI